MYANLVWPVTNRLTPAALIGLSVIGLGLAATPTTDAMESSASATALVNAQLTPAPENAVASPTPSKSAEDPADVAEPSLPPAQDPQPEAQEEPDASTTTGDSTAEKARYFEEVTVTARKRDESLIDVPISASVFSETALRARGAESLSDLANAAVNFSFNTLGENAQPRFTIRGITSRANHTGIEPSLGFYVDGVLMGRPVAFDIELADVESVEILRGPQGTFFGRNTIAGAVNIRTTKPDNELRSLCEVQYGSFGTFLTKAMVSGPLVENKLFGKISVYSIQSDGYVDNLFTGNKLSTEDTIVSRAGLRWLPSKNTEINLHLDALKDEHKIVFEEPTTVNFLGVPPIPGPHTVSLDFDPTEDRDNKGVSLSLDHYYASGFSLTSITAYREAGSLRSDDVDMSPIDALASTFDTSSKTFSQELRLTSPNTRRLAYVLGIFYLDQRLDTIRIFASGPLLGLGGADLTNTGFTSTKSIAAFAHMTFDVTDRLQLFAGARITKEEKDFLWTQDAPFPLPVAVGFVNFSDTDSSDESDISPTVGISYSFTETIRGYVSYASGFKGNGWNAVILSNNGMGGPTSADEIQFDSEKLDSIEIGLKSILLSNRLSLNAAAFHSSYTDLQVLQINPTTGIGEFTNAARATSKGFEIEITARPTERLELSGGVGYTDATFDEFRNAAGIGIHFDGNRLPYAPQQDGNISAQYSLPLSDSYSLVLRGDYSFIGDTYFNSANLMPQDLQEGYGLTDARVGVVTGSGWDIFAWGRNLTNQEYTTYKSVGPFDVGEISVFGIPRAYGVTVRYRYE